MANYEAFEVAEVEEDDEEPTNSAFMFTPMFGAANPEIDRKISSTSTCSNVSFQSSISSYD